MQHVFAAKPVFDKALFVTSQALKLLPLLLCLGFINVLRAQSPNIIFILADDIGYKTPGVNGGNSYSTPNLDLMAKQGMNFTQCHATPLCSPSRVTLLTGKYNFRNYTEWARLDTSQRTIGNMLHDAGYKTAYFGKWQLHGGDSLVHAFGFDHYCIWDALDHTGHDPRYKNPRIYTDGNYMPDYMTAGEYGDDIFTDSVMNFMEKNKAHPFFIYYPMILAHAPYEPTPDDADFASWNSSTISDTAYYRSMIEYMDKKIGQIISKVKSLGIANNTVIIYTGDNGQSSDISENVDEDSVITGGKSSTTEFGTHVPLVIDWEGKIAANSVNNDLIDFSDFFPTMAGIAEIPLPTTYGPLDGVNFYPRLLNQPGNPRSWIFYHYDDHPGLTKLRRWAQNAEYKLYDTSYYNSTRLFYDIQNDINELHPIPDSLLTPGQVLVNQQLLAAINSYVAQGVPLFLGTEVNSLTDTSVQAEDSILINGGSTIKACGFVWSTDSFPTLSASFHVSVDAQIGAISKSITGLMPTTTYYLRSYATNYAGTAYGKQIVFKTLFTSPVATAATDIDSVAFTAFTANWNIVNNADNYNLDVSASRTFETIKRDSIKQLFKDGVVPENGWTFSKYIGADNTDFGKSAPSVKFIASGEQVVTPVLNGYATELKFWMKGLNTDSKSSLTVEGFDGSKWIVLRQFSKIETTGTRNTLAISKHYLLNNIIQFRFTYAKSAGDLAFDDVTIKYNTATPSFVSGFNSLGLQQNSYHISGLKPKTIYYYRVRAVRKNNISANSNIITVDTCFRPVIEKISTINSICNGDNTGGITIVANGKLLGYNWKGPSGFNSIESNLTGLKAGDYHLILTSNRSCAIDTTVKITEPDTLKALENLKPTACNGDLTTLTINAIGGTGNYQYSLLDGSDTIGPQNINSFTILKGSYKVMVQDENHCSFISMPVIITQPEPITITTNAEPIKCTGSTTTLTVNAKGGSAGYHYSLSDGVKIIGPQEDNHFLLHAGNYTVTVGDSNNCFQNENISINDATISCVDAVVFPNPSSNEFNLSIQNATVANVEIIVVDMYGKKVFQATGINTTQLKFGKNFPAGVYVLHIKLGDAVKTFKLIKARQ